MTVSRIRHSLKGWFTVATPGGAISGTREDLEDFRREISKTLSNDFTEDHLVSTAKAEPAPDSGNARWLHTIAG